MKKITKQFIKWWMWMQMPLYGGLFYVNLLYLSYFWAWLLTNSMYAILMFPIMRGEIFNNEERT